MSQAKVLINGELAIKWGNTVRQTRLEKHLWHLSQACKGRSKTFQQHVPRFILQTFFTFLTSPLIIYVVGKSMIQILNVYSVNKI